MIDIVVKLKLLCYYWGCSTSDEHRVAHNYHYNDDRIFQPQKACHDFGGTYFYKQKKVWLHTGPNHEPA